MNTNIGAPRVEPGTSRPLTSGVPGNYSNIAEIDSAVSDQLAPDASVEPTPRPRRAPQRRWDDGIDARADVRRAEREHQAIMDALRSIHAMEKDALLRAMDEAGAEADRRIVEIHQLRNLVRVQAEMVRGARLDVVAALALVRAVNGGWGQ